MVLMLGEAQDMRTLSELLVSFAQSAGEMSLAAAKGFAQSDTQIMLTGPDNERLGDAPFVAAAENTVLGARLVDGNAVRGDGPWARQL